MTRLIFLGAPGAGKGTQAASLAEFKQIPHISTGDLLRQAVAEQSTLGIQAQNYMSQGELVPDSLIMGLIKERLGQLDAQQGWILDGFPRNLPQAEALNNLLLEMQQNYDQVIYLEVSPEILVNRLLKRGRKDDSEVTVHRRLDVYQEQTVPMIEFYRDVDSLQVVNGNSDVETVAQSLREILTA